MNFVGIVEGLIFINHIFRMKAEMELLKRLDQEENSKRYERRIQDDKNIG